MKNILILILLHSFSRFLIAGNGSSNQIKEVTSANQIEITGWALNSSFVIPTVTYHGAKNEFINGSFSSFNSTGAGIGFSWGKIRYQSLDGSKITDKTVSNNLNIEMKDIFSIYFGCLFSMDNSGEILQQSFAPTLYLGLLDFHIGLGYELGDVGIEESRYFTSITYNVPVSKLSDKGSYVLTKIKIKGSTVQAKNLNSFF